MENKAKYQLDDWVGAVRSDPRNTDPLTLLQGFLGASSEAGHIRVYSDESLNSFVEVPEEAILHSVKMTPTESSLGGSKLWLRADSVITFGDPKLANRPKSTFLDGDIMQQFGTSPAGQQPDPAQMAGAMGDAPGQGAGAMATTPLVVCGPNFVTRAIASVCHVCPTRFVSCFRTVCGFTKPFIQCQPPCLGFTRRFPSLGGCPSFGACPSIACGPGLPGNPGGPVFNPGAGAGVMDMAGQPDTTQMGGYYGTFNPYMY